MENAQTDDIARLLQQLDLDQTKYKVFRDGPSSRLRSSFTEVFEEDSPEPRALLPGYGTEAAEDRLQSSSITKCHEPLANTGFDRSLHSTERQWATLASFLNLDSARVARRLGAERDRAGLLLGIHVYGACGGVGTSTIVAALGRISAKSGQRALLIDSSSPSFLPLHFGAQSPRSYTSTFNFSGQFREHALALHVGCGKREELLQSFEAEVDRFYVDGGLFRACESGSAESSASRSKSVFSMIVLSPDARCLAELNRLERQKALPYLLLSQFDELNPLHREVQDLLSERFPEHLIPLTVRYHPDVPLALAHGTTICDYAPASSAAEDLYKLHEWLAHDSKAVASRQLMVVGEAL